MTTIAASLAQLPLPASCASPATPLLALADALVELPVRGVSNSLNVALCASAVLDTGLSGRRPGPPAARTVGDRAT